MSKAEVKISHEDSSEEEEMADDEFSDMEDNDSSQMEDSMPGNKGWATVMASILNKKTDKNVILAKALSEKELTRKRKLKEAEDGENEADTEKIISKAEHQLSIEKKRRWEEMGRVKPDVTQKEKERALQRVATRGVVQLFNAVKKRQSTIQEKLKGTGRSEIKKDKVLKSMSKGEFIDMLKGANTNITSQPVPETKKQIKENTDEEEAPKWGILRDSFMMGAKMKDWDKHDSSDDDDDDHSDDFDQSDPDD